MEKQWFRNCAPFLRRTIEIVQPRVVVTLGMHAYEAVCRAYQITPRTKLLDAVENPDAIEEQARIVEMQMKDWQRV